MKQIYLLLFCIFINVSNLNCASKSKTDKEATTKESVKENPLIEAVKNEQLQRIKVLLGQEQFSPEILAQALKIAKQKGKKELVHLIYEYSPERKKVEEAIQEHLPAPIASIIEEYARSHEPREIEEEFFKILEKENLEIEEMNKAQPDAGYYEPIKFDEDYFIKLNQLSNYEKKRLLQLLEKMFERNFKSIEGAFGYEEFNEFRKNQKDILDKFKEESSKNTQELFDKIEDLFNRSGSELRKEIFIIIYKYLFFILPEHDRKQITHPSEFETYFKKQKEELKELTENYDSEYESEHGKTEKKDKA